jgi:hypothetical protein
LEDVDVADGDLDVEVTVNDSPSAGRSHMSIAVYADRS